MAEKSFIITNMEQMLNLFGTHDSNIRIIENELNVNIVNRGSELKISGNESNVERASSCVDALLKAIKNGDNITEQQVRYYISMVDDSAQQEILSLSDGGICVTAGGKVIKPNSRTKEIYKCHQG